MSIRKLLFIFITCPVFAENVNLNWVVDNETYANTTCSYGNDVNLPAPPQKSGYTFVGWKVQNYIPVEYIALYHFAEIDTKIGSDKFSYPIIEMRALLGKPIFSGSVFMTTTNNNSGKFVWSVNPAGNEILCYGRGTTCSGLVDQPGYNRAYDIVNKIKTLRIGGNEAATPIYADGKLVATVGDTVPDFSGLPITDTIKIQAFDNKTEKPIVTIYFLKIKDIDGTVLFDGVPAKDLSGTPCMYDLVTHKCFYKEGSGTITAGPEIE